MIADGNAAVEAGDSRGDIEIPVESKGAMTDAQNTLRSQRNVTEWNGYLSEECVASMVQQGWDVST